MTTKSIGTQITVAEAIKVGKTCSAQREEKMQRVAPWLPPHPMIMVL